ncbi:hypothetical protein Scep_011292 [Stephania cephalantha]|uniref:Pentatricopeptide repeat-containing protein n=1 Tax=Stephania cephalantha TaxID=152367 RepID=A0AAP0JD23_9MAGN
MQGFWSRSIKNAKMKKIVCSNAFSKIRVSPFSTETATSSSSSAESLYRRVSAVADSKASIAPVLDQWVEEGNPVKRDAFQSLIQRMRTSRRYQHALEISQWIAKDGSVEQTPIDAAVQLDLIFKSQGLQHAEQYFDSIVEKLKASQPYGALLNCYVKNKSVQKAEALAQEMKNMGFLNTPFAYNKLTELYSQTGQHEKINTLMDEMKVKGVIQDKFTWKIRLNACVAASDIVGMESILHEMEKDPIIVVEWKLYAIASDGYVKAGLVDKALVTLKKVEEIAIERSAVAAFEYLLSQYASLGKKNELLRAWSLFKATGEVTMDSYTSMITYLENLDDIHVAEKIWEEFESNGTDREFRVLKQLIVSCCKKGFFEKAESLIKQTEEKAGEISWATDSVWKILATGYLKDEQIGKAIEMFKKSLSVSKRRLIKPGKNVLATCFSHFEGQGDVQGAEDFVKLLSSKGPLTREVYHSLLRTYIKANKQFNPVLKRMKADGLPANEETQQIVGGSATA